MRKRIECGAIVPGCDYVARGDNEEDVMMKAAEHARTVHGIERMSNELRAKVRSAIRDEETVS